MRTNLHIQNFGKVKSVNIQLRPFTVIVGPNSSGKSFVTKALYSIFHSMNKDLTTDFLMKRLASANEQVSEISEKLIRPSHRDIITINKLLASLSSLEEAITDIYEDITILDNALVSKQVDKFYPQIKELFDTLHGQLSVGLGTKLNSVSDEISLLEYDIKNIRLFSDSIESIYISQFQSDLKQEFLENFQVLNLEQLFSSENNCTFKFSNIGSIELKDHDVNFSLNRDSIAELQQIYNVVYLESPIYFKLKKALRNVRFSNFSLRRKGFLNQVPKYFYDLEQLIDSKISGSNSEFLPILELIERKINGSLNVTNGDITFTDHTQQDVEIPLNMVSSGISNLGLISLLIKQNVLSKGSYLFIDEPEVNLHTEWQHVMLDVLVELSKIGVMVVIATHSLDMVYRFEHLVSKEKDLALEEHFSLNRLTQDGTSIPSEGLVIDIRYAKEDLGRPYVKLLKERLPL